MNIRTLAEGFRGRGPLLNIVLDGWGIGKQDEGDAIFNAKTPTYDRLVTSYANTKVFTHGHYVGLPSATDIGGSEVGHMTMGAGRIIPQGPTRIAKMLDDGTFFQGEAIRKLVGNCIESDGSMHLIGLLSDGNVHSHISHFEAIIRHCSAVGVKRLFVHALLDGRDVPYQSALDYIDSLESLLRNEEKKKADRVYAIASGGGREVLTMDRDKNWDKVKLGWNVHVNGTHGTTVTSVADHVKADREKYPNIVDQDISPFVVARDGKPIGPVKDGDSMIFMNFRGDRASQFAQAIEVEGFSEFDVGNRPKILFAGMTVYDEDTNLPKMRLVGTPAVKDPFGKRILEQGLRQFRLTETQKFAHVTFFYNGGYREPLDVEKETYHLIPSDKIQSFAEKPEMKAKEIADQAIHFLDKGEYQFGLINFANADMVGHTGDYPAVIQAVEAVDKALGRIVSTLEQMGGLAIITADHGNADEMITANPKTRIMEPSTRHSINPVPFILVDPQYGRKTLYKLKENEDGPNTLANLMATNFVLLGQEPPEGIEAPVFDLA